MSRWVCLKQARTKASASAAGVLVEAARDRLGRVACQPPFSLYLEQRGADFLIARKHSRRKGFPVIRDRLTYGRKAPWQATLT
jgi:hypothetical protein